MSDREEPERTNDVSHIGDEEKDDDDEEEEEEEVQDQYHAHLQSLLDAEVSAHAFTKLQLEDERANVQLGVEMIRALQTESKQVEELKQKLSALERAIQEPSHSAALLNVTGHDETAVRTIALEKRALENVVEVMKDHIRELTAQRDRFERIMLRNQKDALVSVQLLSSPSVIDARSVQVTPRPTESLMNSVLFRYQGQVLTPELCDTIVHAIASEESIQQTATDAQQSSDNSTRTLHALLAQERENTQSLLETISMLQRQLKDRESGPTGKGALAYTVSVLEVTRLPSTKHKDQTPLAAEPSLARQPLASDDSSGEQSELL